MLNAKTQPLNFAKKSHPYIYKIIFFYLDVSSLCELCLLKFLHLIISSVVDCLLNPLAISISSVVDCLLIAGRDPGGASTRGPPLKIVVPPPPAGLGSREEAQLLESGLRWWWWWLDKPPVTAVLLCLEK